MDQCNKSTGGFVAWRSKRSDRAMFEVLSWQTCAGTTASEICTRRLGANSVQFKIRAVSAPAASAAKALVRVD
jgi:hypothetical protein